MGERWLRIAGQVVVGIALAAASATAQVPDGAAAAAARVPRRFLRRHEVTVTLPGGVPLVLVRVRAGAFAMGSPAGERGRSSWEDPQHAVTIAGDYLIGKTEVTQAQWQAVTGQPMPASCGSPSVGPDFPVHCVSWNDVAGPGGFIEKLNLQQGTTSFRLPSEAEWEHAARAGTTSRFSFGDVLDCFDLCIACPVFDQYMWWCDNSGAHPHPVMERLANPWGLFDVHGNVWEWVQDWWHPSYAGAPADGSAWEVPVGFARVVRGGSWYTAPQVCRSANRYYSLPTNRIDTVGFRLAWTP